MQVFVPFADPIEIAKTMWVDKKRFNKQIIECKQILNAIDGKGKGWINHPVVLMYKPFRLWLYNYMMCLASYREYKNGYEHGYNLFTYFGNEANKINLPFLTEEFCDQHKRRLFTKSPELYPQFSIYGNSDINFYFVNNKLIKYKNGKLIK